MAHSAIRNLNHTQMAVIAKRSLAGESMSDITGAYGLTFKDLQQLSNRQAFRDIMSSEQGYFDWVVARMRLKMAMNGEDYVDRVQNTGADNSNPSLAFQANKFLIDKLMPTKQHVVSENRTQVNVDAEVLISAGEALNKIITLFKNTTIPDEETYTFRGTEGIETAELDAGTLESSMSVLGPNGSGNRSENDCDGKPEPPDTQ